ncbi:MAG: septum formation initiator family protein [Deltaproteobacteria bacterium]|nr:septum formation initiator family protein [Deltaproteobacteria bacterium]
MTRTEKILIYILSFILIAILTFIIFGKDGFRNIAELKKKRDTIIEANEKIAGRNRKTARIINRLTTDPEYIEHIARQDIGMVKEDEIVIQFADKKEILKNDKE